MKRWALMLIGITMASAPALVSAQISLATVVDLAQRNSSAVKLAEADVQKANAALMQTEDVFCTKPNLRLRASSISHDWLHARGTVTFSGTVQSMAFSLSQKEYIGAARWGTKAVSLSLKDAREQVTLDASTAYIELGHRKQRVGRRAATGRLCGSTGGHRAGTCRGWRRPVERAVAGPVDGGPIQAQTAAPGDARRNSCQAACGTHRAAGWFHHA